MRNKLTYLWEDSRITGDFAAGVSLHGHTNRSRESLFFIDDFMKRNALLRLAMKRLDRRAQRAASIKPNLSKAYWTPPLPPLEAFTADRGRAGLEQPDLPHRPRQHRSAIAAAGSA